MGNANRQGLRGFLGDSTAMTQTIETNANPPVKYNDTVWDDLRFPVTQSKRGANVEPDFDETNVGFLFPTDDTSEIAYIIAQFPHDWKTGSVISPHVHFAQGGDNTYVFKIDYKWINLGDAVPATWTTIATTGYAYTYESGTIHQLAEFTDITPPETITDVSSIMLIKLYRDDEVSGDVLVWEFDIHYQRDADGSSSEYVK